jgi:hypothetical protein
VALLPQHLQGKYAEEWIGDFFEVQSLAGITTASWFAISMIPAALVDAS